MRTLRFTWFAFLASLLAVGAATHAATLAVFIWVSRSGGRPIGDVVESISCHCVPDIEHVALCMVATSLLAALAHLPVALVATLLALRLLDGRAEPTYLNCGAAFGLTAPLFAVVLGAVYLSGGGRVSPSYVAMATLFYLAIAVFQGVAYRALARPVATVAAPSATAEAQPQS
jgi:hypothetical protein